MRTVVTTAPGRMRLESTERPRPGPGEALVAIEAVGLCGSDFHLYDGRHPYATFPQIQGHELIGRVAEPGADYTGPAVGERVAIEPLVACGHCFACRTGHYNCCPALQVMGAHVPGGLRDFLAVAAGQLHPIGALPTRSAVLIEPLSIGLQCVVRAGVRAGDDVVVLGAGPIGQTATLCAVDRGARVLVVDRVASRLHLATRLGATATGDSTARPLAEAVTDFAGPDGPRVVIEATGAPELISAGLELVAHSGTVVVVGISAGAVSIPVGLFSRKEINILGSRNNAGLFPECVALATRYAEQLAALVTHTFPLEQTGAALQYAMHHPSEVHKAVVLIGEGVA